MWKDIPGFGGRYQISDAGEVWSNITNKVLKPKPVRGYQQVPLMTPDSKVKRFYVSRLVLLTFVGDPPTPNHQAAHGDGNELNNHLSNLRWATQKENEADKIVHGTRYVPTPEYRKAMGIRSKLWWETHTIEFSDEEKKRRSDWLRNLNLTNNPSKSSDPIVKQRISEALKGRTFSEEHRRRLSEAAKRRYAR